MPSLKRIFRQELTGRESLLGVFNEEESLFPFDDIGEDDPKWVVPEEEEASAPPAAPPEKEETFTFKINFNRGVLWPEYQKALLKEFLPFVKAKLKIKTPIIIYLLNKRQGEMTTASFDLESDNIMILAKNRHHVDVFRSIAHEIVHLKQKENKMIGDKPVPDIGGKIEDQANAIAGQLIKHFAKKVGKKKLYDIRDDVV